MADFPLLWMLPAATFVLVIAFALWSKKRAEDASPDKTTPLARSKPDPKFTPSAKVTDPQGVMRSS